MTSLAKEKQQSQKAAVSISRLTRNVNNERGGGEGINVSGMNSSDSALIARHGKRARVNRSFFLFF